MSTTQPDAGAPAGSPGGAATPGVAPAGAAGAQPSATLKAARPSARLSEAPRGASRGERMLYRTLTGKKLRKGEDPQVKATLWREKQEAAAREAAEAAKKAPAPEVLTKAQAVIKETAARMMVGLSEKQAAAVKATAGDDPAAQLAAINALAPTWAAAEAAPPPAAAAGAPTAVVPPAPGHDTAPPAGSAPPAPAPGGTPNPRAVYEQMREQNPFASARFGLANPTVYGST